MAYRLRPGVTFCIVAGRCIFLDVPNDRYFALAADAEPSFLKLVDDAPLTSADDIVLKRIAESGPLERVEGNQPALAVPEVPRIGDSLIDPIVECDSAAETIVALWHLKSAARRLRRLGLAGALRALAARKRTARGGLSRERAAIVAAAFSAAGAYSAVLDQCLPRSLAVANRLTSLGGAPDLIIGVKLQPFQAHCWAQCAGHLVNERCEVVRMFTPILVL